jgi:hypothetical protein
MRNVMAPKRSNLSRAGLSSVTDYRATRRAELQQELRWLAIRAKDQFLTPEEREAVLLSFAETHRAVLALGDQLTDDWASGLP